MLHSSCAGFEPSKRDPRTMAPTWVVADSGGPERASLPIRREPRGRADPTLVGVAVCRCQPRPSERLDACVCDRKLVLWVGSGIMLRRACPGRSTCSRAWVRPTVQGLDPRFAAAFWPARAGLSSSPPHGASFFGGLILRRQRETMTRSVGGEGCAPRGRLSPCRARADGGRAGGAGPSRVVVHVHKLLPTGLA